MDILNQLIGGFAVALQPMNLFWAFVGCGLGTAVGGASLDPAQLATSTVTLGQILKMRVGDVIPVNIPESVVAHVDDVPLMECKYGQQGGQYALKIERFMSSESQEPALGENNV
ncbi:MAG: FliM/FliN family flagellar motor switch protein [Candidatus Accumulibacter sp.]|nr:FliM/FliN family flagellar motor switch protein [Accumulibacter sp.]